MAGVLPEEVFLHTDLVRKCAFFLVNKFNLLLLSSRKGAVRLCYPLLCITSCIPNVEIVSVWMAVVTGGNIKGNHPCSA